MSQRNWPVPTGIEVLKNSKPKNLYDDFYNVNWQPSTAETLAHVKISTSLNQLNSSLFHVSVIPTGWLVGWSLTALSTQWKGEILGGFVHPIEKHWESMLWCMPKRLNWSRCRLGSDLCGPKEPYIRWKSQSDESIRRRKGWLDSGAALY